MTLEEAIRHAEEKAKCGGQCGEEHEQLAMWLKELQERRAAELEKRTEERTETHACDCISRRKAFEYFVTLWECIGTIMDRDEWEDVCMATANEIPSAQPERKTGRWLPDNRPGGGFWVCSCCKFPSEAFAADKLYKYCPVCGAYMGGEQDGSDR